MNKFILSNVNYKWHLERVISMLNWVLSRRMPAISLSIIIIDDGINIRYIGYI